MDLVHDHGADRPEHGAAALCRNEEVEALRRCNEQVWRDLRHGGPCRLRGIACADPHAQFRYLEPELRCDRFDLGQRSFQVLMDVYCERLER